MGSAKDKMAGKANEQAMQPTTTRSAPKAQRKRQRAVPSKPRES